MTDHTCTLRFHCPACGKDELFDALQALDVQMPICCILALKNLNAHIVAVATKQSAMAVHGLENFFDTIANTAVVSKNPMLREAAVKWRNIRRKQ